jgi:hypothetical protein
VNAISPYRVTILPRKDGRKVVGFIMGWSMKDQDGLKEAYCELHRPRIGRKERLTGRAESPVDGAVVERLAVPLGHPVEQPEEQGGTGDGI